MGRKRKIIYDLKQSSFRVKKSILKFKTKSFQPTIQQLKPNDDRNKLIQDVDIEKNYLQEYSAIDNSDNLGDSFNELNFKSNLKDENANESADTDLGSFVGQVIRKNSIRYNLGRRCVSNMLQDLKIHFPNLPSDYRTLLKTPRCTELRNVTPGQYTHFGISNNLKKYLRTDHEEIKIDIFIDGFAIFNDTSLKSFWIILGRLEKNIFPIGIFNGDSQPKDFNDFLLDFCVEAKKLIVGGIHNGDRVVSFGLNNILMDSPAKSHVTYTKHHTGYRSCYYCYINGYHDGLRVCFFETDCKLRTNTDFKDKIDTAFHHGTSILESLDVKMIEQIPIDYLHCVLLGIVKKILNKLFTHKTPLLSQILMKKVSKAMMFCNEFLCSEIHRKFRDLKDLKSFHGNEFRVFLLKIGIVVLRNNIPNDIYNNFLLLHVAITILCDPILSLSKNNFAEYCLKLFISDSIEIYGTEIATSVLHDLQHLPQMVRQYQAPLDSFSTFPFENYLLKLKNLVHTNNKPLPQIHRRITEMLVNEEENQEFQANEYRFIYSRSSINSVFMRNFKFSTSGCRDRFIMCDKKNIYVIIGIRKNKNGKPVFKVRKLKSLGNFYDLPVHSSKLDIIECECSYDGPVYYLNHSEIYRKMLGVPYSSHSMVFVPMKDMN